MSNAKDALLTVLRETRALLALPGNDFVWSRWDSAADALFQLDCFMSHVEAGRRFDGSKLSILFAPTGAIQEVSMSSGWGDEFLSVAERFDCAFAQYRRAENA
jgi:hypothetical protein